jgi:hypothetical protein
VTLPGSTWATPGGSACPTPVAHYGATADTPAVVAVLEALSAAWGGPPRPALVVAGLMGATGCSRSRGYRAVSDAAAAGLIAWDPRTNALERVSDPEIAA